MNRDLTDMTTGERKELFLVWYELHRGNATAACNRLGISYNSYIRWKREDPEFRAAVAVADEGLLDWAEGRLVDSIESGNDVNLRYFLDAKGKERGYGVRSHQHAGPGGGAIPFAGMVGVVSFPPRPETVAEWEQQVRAARAARDGKGRTALGSGDVRDAEVVNG